MAFFACSARFGKNGDFLAAQPPKRSFDRPVRWYLRYLRARDVQSATLPLVYVTAGGSNLPVRPKKRPPSAQTAIAKRVVSNARSAIFGVWACFPDLHGNMPHDRFFGWTQTAELHGDCPEKQQICQKKTKKKSPGGIELTTTRRPQQITMGSETMGLTIPLKNPPISLTS